MVKLWRRPKKPPHFFSQKEMEMNEKTLRKNAALLARECRGMERLGDWKIKEWNDQIRITIRRYMESTRMFCKINGMWDL